MTRKTKVSVDYVFITPTKATKLLNQNINNRNVSVAHIKRYVQMMLDNEWQETGDTIRFDTNGYCIDGQHRLMSIEKSKCSQFFVVVKNLHPDAKFFIDTGKARSLSDAFRMAGIENGGIYSQVCRFLEIWMAGKAEPKDMSKSQRAKQKHFKQMVDYFEENAQQIRDIYQRVNKFESQVKMAMPRAVVVASILYAQKTDNSKAEYAFEFFKDLFECKDSRGNKLPKLLRNELITQNISSDRRYKTGKRNQMLIWCLSEYKHNRSHRSLEMPTTNMFELKTL